MCILYIYLFLRSFLHDRNLTLSGISKIETKTEQLNTKAETKPLFFWLDCNVVLPFFMVIAFSCMHFTNTLQVNSFSIKNLHLMLLVKHKIFCCNWWNSLTTWFCEGGKAWILYHLDTRTCRVLVPYGLVWLDLLMWTNTGKDCWLLNKKTK